MAPIKHVDKWYGSTSPYRSLRGHISRCQWIKDRALFLLVGAFVIAVFCAVVYSAYFHATHHCVASHEHMVPATMFEDVNHIWHTLPAHMETVCDVYERNR